MALQDSVKQFAADFDDLSVATSGLNSSVLGKRYPNYSMSLTEFFLRADELRSLSYKILGIQNAAKGQTVRNLIADRILIFTQIVDAISGATRGVSAAFKVTNANGGFARIDDGDGNLYSKNNTPAGIANHLNSAWKQFPRVLEVVAPILAVTRPKFDESTSALKTLQQDIETLRGLVVSAEKIHNELKADRTKSQEEIKSISEFAENAEKTDGMILQIHNTAQSRQAEISQYHAATKDIRENAARLESEITAFQPKYELFRDNLASREQELKTLQEMLEDQITRSEAFLREVQSAKDRSEAILGIATGAGLSQSYMREKELLSRELHVAQRQFLWSNIFLLCLFLFGIAGLPLLGKYFNIDLPNIFELRSDAGETLLKLLSSLAPKIAWLLPGIFLVGYWARRIGALARLREQYTHKVTVAASVEGFRRQSPKYSEGMVAIAYETLIAQSSDLKSANDAGLAGQVPDQPSWVFDKLLGRLKRKTQEPANPES